MDGIEFRNNLSSKGGIYIGPEPTDYFSSFTNSIFDELLLHDKYSHLNMPSDFLEDMGLAQIKDVNPFMLSGGQSVMLAVLSGLLCSSDELKLDICTEQLSATNKKRLFDVMKSDTFKNITISVNDNRLDEMEFQEGIQFASIQNAVNANKINGNIEIPFDQTYNDIYTVTDLSFSYNKTTKVLDNISYTFLPGNVYFLNGENGVGKSTFCKLLMGLLKANHGTFSKNGNIIKPYKYPGKYASYTFQSPREQIFSETVVGELISNSGTLYDTDLLAKAFGLNDILMASPFEQEYEVKKRIVLASAFAPKPLIILDEPTVGQNGNDVIELCKIIKKYIKTGISFILTSHSQKFKAIFDEATNLEIKNGQLKEI